MNDEMRKCPTIGQGHKCGKDGKINNINTTRIPKVDMIVKDTEGKGKILLIRDTEVVIEFTNGQIKKVHKEMVNVQLKDNKAEKRKLQKKERRKRMRMGKK